MLLMAKGRGFSPKYVLFDGWYASLENLKQVRDHGWQWLTRLKGNRQVTPEDRVAPIARRGGRLGAAGTVRPPARLRPGPGVPDRRPRRRRGVLGDQRPGDGRRGCGGSTPRWASRSRTTTGS